MKRSSVLRVAIVAGALSVSGLASQAALACNATDFGAVVDQTARALRELNVNGAWRFQAKLVSLRQKHNLSEEEIQSRADALQDDKMSEFNREIENLVAQMDTLSQTPNDKITCEKLEELKRVRDGLLTVMGQKSGYMLAKADVELDRPAGSPPPAPKSEPRGAAKAPTEFPAPVTASKEDRLSPAPAEQRPPAPREEASLAKQAPIADFPPVKTTPLEPPVKTTPLEPPVKTTPLEPSVKTTPIEPKEAAPAKPAPVETKEAAHKETPPPLNPGLPERREGPQRTAKTWAPDAQPASPSPGGDRRQAMADNRNQEPPAVLAPPPAGDQPLPLPSDRVEGTYSMDEIQEVGRGIFGTITAQFAGAVNYAFQQFGRPNAYITGSEGGAAILAGLRYGNGVLHSKAKPDSPIYWQGPSLGADLGAEGSNALFLLYNVEDPYNIYGRFSGIGGSAYVAGGVGVNVLGKGGMVMVPIRSGLGLRLGANLAYLKFTERQTWNPF